MTLKTFFQDKNIKLFESTDKKVINQNMYSKFYIRSQIVDSNPVFILDNNNIFSNISRLELSRFKNKEFVNLGGCSLNAQPYLYKNKRNDALYFKSFLLNSLVEKNNLSCFYQSLQNLKNKKNLDKGFSTSLLILKPIKGGFSCYSSGVFGFLPRSHGLFFFKFVLFSIIGDSKIERKFLNLSSLRNTSSFSIKYFIFRLKFLLGKVTVYSQYKKKNFSKSTKRKRRTFLNRCNFVFLSNKSRKNLKNYYAKDKKIFRK